MAFLADMQNALDPSKTPPAAQWYPGRDKVFHLSEVPLRIELPSDAELPDSAAFDVSQSVQPKDGEKNGGETRSASWTTPHVEIAVLRVEEHSVKRRRTNLTAKLGVSSVAELVHFSVAAGLCEPE